MFCPSCGFQDQSPSNFCKRCGTNLGIVMDALTGKLSRREDEEIARQRAIEDELLKDALKRRRKLLTGGIISGCVGVGMMLMLSLIEGPETAAAGLIPFMVGLGLILSALLIYKPNLPWQHQPKKMAESPPRQIGATSTQVLTTHPESAPDSVTTETTRRLEEPIPPPRAKE
jgi:hypothetical protein